MKKVKNFERKIQNIVLCILLVMFIVLNTVLAQYAELVFDLLMLNFIK